MSSQPSLISVALDTQVQRPSSYSQWQFFRDTAVAGSGSYYAMNKDGVKESICCRDSGALLHARLDVTNSQLLSLNDTPVEIIPAAGISEIIIIQTKFWLLSEPFTMAANNVLGLQTGGANYPQAISDIMTSTQQRQNIYGTLIGQAPAATTSNTGLGGLNLIVHNTTGGATSNPTSGDGSLTIDVWYVLNER